MERKEYKGYGGWKIIIDGNNLFIKQLFIKENCTFDDVTIITKEEPTLLKNGTIKIFTKKQNIVPYQLNFSKSNQEMLDEIYEILLEKAPHASALNVVRDALLIGDVEDALKVLNERNVNIDMDEFNILYENDKFKARNYLQQLIEDDNAILETGNESSSMKYCPECGTKIDGVKFCPECGNPIASKNINGTYKESASAIINQKMTPTNMPTTNISISNKKHMSCPSCGSTNIQIMGNDRKGFSASKAIGGAILTGGIGTLAGFSGKKGKYDCFCSNCGYRFKIK